MPGAKLYVFDENIYFLNCGIKSCASFTILSMPSSGRLAGS